MLTLQLRWSNSLASSLGRSALLWKKQLFNVLHRCSSRLFDELTDKHEVYKAGGPDVESFVWSYATAAKSCQVYRRWRPLAMLTLPVRFGSSHGFHRLSVSLSFQFAASARGRSTFDLQKLSTVCGAFWFGNGPSNAQVKLSLDNVGVSAVLTKEEETLRSISVFCPEMQSPVYNLWPRLLTLPLFT